VRHKSNRTPRILLHVLFCALLPSAGFGQARERPVVQARHEVAILLESVAGGIQYLRTGTGRLVLGASLTAGPQFGLTISDADVDDIRAWASAHATLGLGSSEGLRFLLSPIGASVIVGNDFGAVYPSGEAGIELARGRLRLGTLMRMIRIAGANGTGNYWTRWVPLRVGYGFTL